MRNLWEQVTCCTYMWKGESQWSGQTLPSIVQWLLLHIDMREHTLTHILVTVGSKITTDVITGSSRRFKQKTFNHQMTNRQLSTSWHCTHFFWEPAKPALNHAHTAAYVHKWSGYNLLDSGRVQHQTTCTLPGNYQPKTTRVTESH